jgi:hypothetical protein
MSAIAPIGWSTLVAHIASYVDHPLVTATDGTAIGTEHARLC